MGRRSCRGLLITVGMVLAAVAAACSDDDAAPSTADDASTDPAQMSDGPDCDWPMWGHGLDRTFAYPCDTEIDSSTVGDLTRVWFHNTSDVVTAAPVIVDGRLFVGDWAGRVYALDAASGDELWFFDTDFHDNVYAGQIVASASAATVDGQSAIVVNGGRTTYALAADDGEELWRHAFGEEGLPTEIETAPIVADGIVVITYDTHNAPFKAGVAALAENTGEILWEFDLEDGDWTGCGDVWGAASVDLEHRMVFAGSANCSSLDEWGPYTESIFAVDLDTGEPLWAFQPHEPNLDDSDFAGAPILFEADGRELVALGNKDAVMYVVDRLTGDLVWSTRATNDNVIRDNFASGGFVGPSAYAEGIIAGGTAVGDCPCMHAFDAATGEILWQQPAVGPTYAPSTIVGDVVFVGSLDFNLRALALQTGEVLWSDELTGLISGGVAAIGPDVWAVAGFREPGSPGPSETSGVFRYTVDPDQMPAPTTTVGPAEEENEEDNDDDGTVAIRLTNDGGRCIDAPCDLSFDFKTPPEGTDPSITLYIQTDPFELTVSSSGLGDPSAWIREGSSAVEVGSTTYGVLVSERDDSPNGGYLCVLGEDGSCTATSVPTPGASYNRISILTLDDPTVVPGNADGFDRLVASIAFDPPLQTELIGGSASAGDEVAGPILFSGQGNDLVAYTADGDQQLVIANANDDPAGRDINGQVCFLADGRFIAGEDTGQPEVPAGFGIFELDGSDVGTLSARQVGKLSPTFQSGDQAEPYGCTVLADGRVVTTDVGNQSTGDGTGQLIVWFPPFADGDTAYCKVDTTIATAGQVVADSDNSVLVASARPPTVGVWRYDDLPISVDDCNATDATGAPSVGAPSKELFIEIGDGGLLIANGVARAGAGWYVGSVLNGVINEYDETGDFVRTILEPPGDESLGPEPFSTGTPMGLAVTADGTLFFADLGLVVGDGRIGPGDSTGTVRRIDFVDGEPQAPVVLDSGLRFPDAVGLLE